MCEFNTHGPVSVKKETECHVCLDANSPVRCEAAPPPSGCPALTLPSSPSLFLPHAFICMISFLSLSGSLGFPHWLHLCVFTAATNRYWSPVRSSSHWYPPTAGFVILTWRDVQQPSPWQMTQESFGVDEWAKNIDIFSFLSHPVTLLKDYSCTSESTFPLLRLSCSINDSITALAQQTHISFCFNRNIWLEILKESLLIKVSFNWKPQRGLMSLNLTVFQRSQ